MPGAHELAGRGKKEEGREGERKDEVDGDWLIPLPKLGSASSVRLASAKKGKKAARSKQANQEPASAGR